MSKKIKTIPLNQLTEVFTTGIAVKKIDLSTLGAIDEIESAHRHDYHLFVLLAEGEINIAVDFQIFELKGSSILYIHPRQVHHIIKLQNAQFYILAVSSEKIDAEYLKLLEQNIYPALPLGCSGELFSVLSSSVALCSTILDGKKTLHDLAVAKNFCNASIGIMVNHYIEKVHSGKTPTRYESVTSLFNPTLENNFLHKKKPSEYALLLNISTSYLNEAVKSATGLPVTFHIQQRIVLEAKRLLYHTDKSVKEIAAELGYTDYAYFSRFFNKAAGNTALSFRNKNRE